MFLEIALWASNSAVGAAIRDSLWLFPVIEAIHLLALAVLGGVIIVIDLRLCGVRFGDRSAPLLARDLQPWLAGSLIVMLVSGALLYASEALKCYDNPAFKLKMILLLAAMAFTFTLRQRTLGSEQASGRWGLFVGIASMLLWFGVGAGGRGIGFY